MAPGQMASSTFEGVLHPVFEADEIKLILVGALLGAAAGFAQIYAYDSNVSIS